MEKHNTKAGMSLVEIMISVVLVGVAAMLVYQGIIYSYKMLARSRARLEAQGIAFDRMWQVFNMTQDDVVAEAERGVVSLPTPATSVFSTEGIVRYSVTAETDAPLDWVEYWEIRVQVWPPAGSPLFDALDTDGSVIAACPDPLADYTIYRYRGER
jgi:prepilin-type N-terminal cleavage/methylation domain-containing protein